MTRTLLLRTLLVGFALVAMTACGDDGGEADAAPDATEDAMEQDTMVEPPVDCSGRSADGPSARGEVAGVYDPSNNRFIVFGGDIQAPVDCMPRYEFVDEIWAFELDCNTWTKLEPGEGGPGIRARHATAYDSTRNRMLVFGGRIRLGFGSYENYNDIWALDLNTDTWQPVAASGTGPSARSSAVTVYDAEKDRLLVFGGNTSTGGLSFESQGDFFELQFDESGSGMWNELGTEGGPGARLYHTGVAFGRSLVMFGGTPSYDGPYLNDMYAYDMDGDTWTAVTAPGEAPAERFGPAIFAAPARQALVVFGGHDATALGNMNDVWDYTFGAGWLALQPGDTPNGEPSGFCMFPADFTIPQENSPERRFSFAHGQSETHGFIFGGKTDCGNINDVWQVDLNTGEWEKLRPATAGEACNRTGRQGCTNLCF